MKNTPFDLTGKVAVITGSSRGIGRSSAELLAKLGAKVVISSRKADACEEVADGIRKQGGDAHVIACNISRRPEVEALISGSIKHYGKIDILVCNAAVNPYYGPLLDITDEAFDKIMGSNVKSNIWLCAQAIPQMAERGNGSVVIISSIGGLRGSPVIGAYGISKAADFSLCRSLAGEWGPKGVRVNCVAPGLVKTDFARAGTPASRSFTVPAGMVYSMGGEVPIEDDVPMTHSMEPELRKLNMPTTLVKGQITLDNP